MLNNPAWNRNAFSLQSLIAWLETQPPEQTYRYSRNDDCLLAQYFTAMGFENVVMLASYFEHGEGKAEFLPVEIDRVAVHLPHTFGAALARAKDMGNATLA